MWLEHMWHWLADPENSLTLVTGLLVLATIALAVVAGFTLRITKRQAEISARSLQQMEVQSESAAKSVEQMKRQVQISVDTLDEMKRQFDIAHSPVIDLQVHEACGDKNPPYLVFRATNVGLGNAIHPLFLPKWVTPDDKKYSDLKQEPAECNFPATYAAGVVLETGEEKQRFFSLAMPKAGDKIHITCRPNYEWRWELNPMPANSSEWYTDLLNDNPDECT